MQIKRAGSDGGSMCVSLFYGHNFNPSCNKSPSEPLLFYESDLGFGVRNGLYDGFAIFLAMAK